MKKLKKNIIIVLAGLPYSGKSSFAEKLSRAGFLHVWATKIKKEMGFTDEDMIRFAKKIITQELKKGRNVVFDFLNHKESIRSQIEVVAKKAHADYEVVYFNLPIETILRRSSRQKSEHNGRTKISPAIIRDIANGFEIPKKSPNVRTRDEADNLVIEFIKRYS